MPESQHATLEFKSRTVNPLYLILFFGNLTIQERNSVHTGHFTSQKLPLVKSLFSKKTYGFFLTVI